MQRLSRTIGTRLQRGSVGILAFLILALFPMRSARAVSPVSEYQVEAAFLLNFTKFIQWPETAFADADSPFAICILGDDPFGKILDEVVGGESVNGRKLVVRRIKEPPVGKSCQILFVAASESGRSVLRGLGNFVLTVGEGEKFIPEGGMI